MHYQYLCISAWASANTNDRDIELVGNVGGEYFGYTLKDQ